jgi:hypothetical protein
MSNGSISVSLDVQLLAQLEALHDAYADLARLNGGDVDAAGDDAIKMALELLTPGAAASATARISAERQPGPV